MLAPLQVYVDTSLRPSAQCNALTAERHHAFIVPLPLGGASALTALKLYLMPRGTLNTILLIFARLVVPLCMAHFSRTGRYQRPHLFSALAMSIGVTAVASSSGSIGSFAAVRLTVLALAASLSASRGVVALASIFALGAARVLVCLDAADPLLLGAASAGWALAALGLVLGSAASGESRARRCALGTRIAAARCKEDRDQFLATT